MNLETVAKPKGRIRLLNHRGEPLFTPWQAKDPTLWQKAQSDALLQAQLKDPRFGVIDLSKAQILDEFEDHNLIVNQASVLMAMRMAPGDLGTGGISYLAVGTGYGSGTQQNPQPEQATYTQLQAEAARLPITSWTYQDGNGNNVAQPPTGIGVIQYTTTFSPTQANFALCEMGLFGGNATGTANSGTLFNYKVFSVWNKTLALNSSLTIIWTITF